jgi:hypothetical protein
VVRAARLATRDAGAATAATGAAATAASAAQAEGRAAAKAVAEATTAEVGWGTEAVEAATAVWGCGEAEGASEEAPGKRCRVAFRRFGRW